MGGGVTSPLDRLAEASANQREFMASVSHELRTPITIARGHLELLERMDPDQQQAGRETVAVLRDELARMGRLVDDLLAMARADMDDFVRPRPVELVQWFEELELRLAGLAATGRTRVDPPPPVTVTVDPGRLAQAVLNLVTNAHVHTPPGTSVEVRATTDGALLTIAVRDDGPGIPADIRDRVFAPFVRAGEAPTSTGLGLAVVRAVVAAHGGQVGLDSGSAGTTVVLELPVVEVEEDGVADTQDLEVDEHEPTAPIRIQPQQ